MTTKQELSTIKNVDIREAWPNEAANFTPWLAEHISELGEALGLDLESTGVEAPVGNYKLDILARDRDRPVAIENQLGETDHTHLGQLLTYMAGYDASVAIWIAGKFRDEHREALDLLNRRTDGESEFFGVVVELWQIDDSRPAPHFRVVSAPNNWGKQTKAKSQDGVASELSQLYSQFFQGLVDNLGQGHDIPQARKVNGRSYQSFRTRYGGSGYGTLFSTKDGGRAQVEVYIDCGDKALNEERFNQLESEREEIESEIGGNFDWERLEDRKACRISVVRPGSIRDNPKNLDEIRSWMIEKLSAFKKTFGPRLAQLGG